MTTTITQVAAEVALEAVVNDPNAYTTATIVAVIRHAAKTIDTNYVRTMVDILEDDGYHFGDILA